MKLKINNYPSELLYQIKSYEKVPVEIYDNANDGSVEIAQRIAAAIRTKAQKNKNLILGLATGSSPLNVYRHLIRIHKEEELSFANVVCFNLDEYYELTPSNQQSYHHFMQVNLFDHVDIPKSNIHIPDGTVTLKDVETYCSEYEEKIERNGGIDIQILGIGRTGHIAFNEPGSRRNSKTRLIRLDGLTRRDAAKDFNGLSNVPYKAITMGVSTIMAAKEIYLMAWGQHKSAIVKKAIEGVIDTHVSASFLQEHPNVKFIIDKAAASKLTRVELPWKVGNCNWTEDLICRAVVWLSNKLDKPILKLTDSDYNEFGLDELMFKVSTAYSLNLKIFNRLQHTITGWPGGKPNVDDKHRPERACPEKKRVVIFSPHPDDDVISMGGTFMRLVEQGHEVHVVYQTSGNIAVHHHETVRFLEFYEEFKQAFQIQATEGEEVAQVKTDLLKSQPALNTAAIRKVKGLIRRGEARAGARFCGLNDEQIHFIDLPFYESGGLRKNDPTDIDVEITANLLKKIKPHQVFAAGDLADPHGTHRICFNIILDALKHLETEKWIQDCWLWLYRGAWQEFGIEEIDMAVPLSPQQLMKKRKAIFMHQSQKDSAPFPGADAREFWQRSEDRNRNTARHYRELGFAEYEAMEAFCRWKFI